MSASPQYAAACAPRVGASAPARRVAAALALVVLGASIGCAADEGSSNPFGVVKQATDPETKVAFRLDGNELRVRIPAEAAAGARRLLRGRVRFFCGPPKYYAIPYAPVPQATTRFPPGAREVAVRLEGLGGVSREAGFCGVEGARGEAFGLFAPVAELLCASAYERADPTPEGRREAAAACREARSRPVEPGAGR